MEVGNGARARMKKNLSKNLSHDMSLTQLVVGIVQIPCNKLINKIVILLAEIG